MIETLFSLLFGEVGVSEVPPSFVSLVHFPLLLSLRRRRGSFYADWKTGEGRTDGEKGKRTPDGTSSFFFPLFFANSAKVVSAAEEGRRMTMEAASASDHRSPHISEDV